MSRKEALKQRKEQKAKKPNFTRHDSHKKKKLKGSWRSPKGLQSKKRLNKRGYGSRPRTGWGSPKEVRGLHPSGYEPVRVHNTKDLEGVDKNEQGIIISSKVGDRKRVAIIEEAQKKDIKILNLAGKEYLKKVEEKMKQRKSSKKEKEDEKEEKKEESSGDEGTDEKKEEEELSAEEKKKKEKKELDKTLTKSK